MKWISESIDHPDMYEFVNGMRLIGERVSADVEIWLDWEKFVPDEVQEEEALDLFKGFLEHWIKKDHMRVFKAILYMFDPRDMEYNEGVPKKWNSLIYDKHDGL